MSETHKCGCFVSGSVMLCKMHAATPALLRACEAALAEIESPDSYWNEEGPLAKQLRAAIQAAKEGK